MKRIFLFCVLAFSMAPLLRAQPLNMDTTVKPVELKLYKYDPKGQPNGKGLLNITRVVQKSDTAYYFCKGLSIYSPAMVVVSAKNKSEPLQVSLHKWNWKAKSREGSTDAKGIWSEKFKTENDFGIMVVASQKPAVYNLYTWVGEEVKVPVPSDFVSMNEFDKKKSSSFLKKNIFLLVAGLVLAAGVFVYLKKRKK